MTWSASVCPEGNGGWFLTAEWREEETNPGNPPDFTYRESGVTWANKAEFVARALLAKAVWVAHKTVDARKSNTLAGLLNNGE